MTLKKIYPLAKRESKRISSAWRDSKASTYGASVAYYTIFSIAPLLIIAVAIAGLVIDASVAKASILNEFTNVFGQSGTLFIDSLLSSRTTQSSNIFLIIAGFIIILLGATGIFSELEDALDSIFEADPKERIGIRGRLKEKLLSIGMVLFVGFLLLVSLATSATVTVVSEILLSGIPGANFLVRFSEISVSFILISLFLSLIYRFLPSKKIGNKASLIGGFIAGAFFTIGKYLVGIYLGSSTAISIYGSAATLVLIIIWAYYMAQIFFFSSILVKLYFLKPIKIIE